MQGKGSNFSIVETKLDSFKDALNEIQTKVDNQQVDRGLERIKSWLTPPDPSTNFHKALRRRHAGSGKWLLRDTSYTTWKRRPHSFLWLYGMPGCGKTVLSSSVVEDLEGDSACSNTLLYFYFDFADKRKQSLDHAVRSLIGQLYHKKEDARKTLDSLYSSHTAGQQPNLKSLCATFETMVEQAGEVWVVLDALDECPIQKSSETISGREDLIRWVQSLGESKMNIHILVTSRPEYDIKSNITTWARSEDTIAIQSSLIEEDIRDYVHTIVGEDKGLDRWKSRPEVQQEIETALLEKADGM
jgi:hypothetical protein